MRLFAAFAAMLLAGCADREPVRHGYEHIALAAWTPVDASTGQIADVDGLLALAKAFPDSGSVRLRLLSAQVRSDDMEGAMESLRWLYDRGYVFSEGGKGQVRAALAGVDAGRVAELLRAQPQTMIASEVVASIPADITLVESVVRHPVSEDLFVSSILRRSVFRLTERREPRRIGSHRNDDISGLAYHAGTDRIMAASGNVNRSEDAEGRFSGLVSIPAVRGTVRRYAAPEGAVFSDVAVGPTGHVYASDPIGGGVYWLRRSGSGEMETLIKPGTLRSPQGIAPDPSGTYVHVSDYRYGLARIDLVTGEISQVRTGPPMPIVLDGIDALFRHGDELIAIQNGTSPMRIVALKLSRDGGWVTGYRILEQAHPDWTEPLGGSIDGNRLLYVGNGQWDVFAPDGSVKEGKEAKPTQIRSLALN